MIRARITALCLALSACAPEPTVSVFWSDGDSGQIDETPFRLHGIDTPETGGVGSITGAKCETERALGYDAKEVALSITRGQPVRVKAEYGLDRHGRMVIDLEAGGQDVAAALVAVGVAQVWDYDGGDLKPEWCE